MWMCQDNDSDIPNCGICPMCKRNVEVLKKWLYSTQDKLEALGISGFFGLQKR